MKRDRIGRWLFPELYAQYDSLIRIVSEGIDKQFAEMEAKLKPQPELTAGDILKHKEQKASGRKPWRVIQREAELESSPEIQRDKRIKQEKKEIENA